MKKGCFGEKFFLFIYLEYPEQSKIDTFSFRVTKFAQFFLFSTNLRLFFKVSGWKIYKFSKFLLVTDSLTKIENFQIGATWRYLCFMRKIGANFDISTTK